MSRPKSSGPKNRFCGWLRTFGRSSSESHLPMSAPVSSSVPLSQISIPGAAEETQALEHASSTPHLSPPPGELPEPSHSAPAPVVDNDRPNPQPTPPSAADMSVSEPADKETNITNQTWSSLRVALQGLGSVSRVFPHLASAASILLACFDGLEAAAKNQPDYEDLARELKSLIQSLESHTNTLGSPSMTKCISGITIEIEQQAEQIDKLKIRNAGRKFLVAKADEEYVLRHYRRIQSLFRQLQASLSQPGPGYIGF
ncbi:unnamed protein product [Rhizoctonia solani]|uniref:Uncharacterized protein n=1 Tax=Rhizoctonia solani TaxID=456999 RepID=A0A8H3DDH4_9AGAM|nr:unnamed protein product [Rhizoctonia solani]